MKKISVILSLIILVSVVFIPVSSSNSYTINGKNIRLEDIPWPGADRCWTYASDMYERIWGQSFNGDTSASDNMLRNLDTSRLTLTQAHLKEYVTHCQIGSTIRICNEDYLNQSYDGYGHSQIIVWYDDTGFIFLESLSSGLREEYYTWEEYVNSSYIGQRYHYIKYIKWPGAPAYKPNDVSEPADIIIKCVTEDGKVIKGAEFKIYDTNWNCVYEAKTDAAGKITVSDLRFGYYYACQESTAKGYAVSDYRQVSLLYGGDTTEIEFRNSPAAETESPEYPIYEWYLNADLDHDGIITRDDLEIFWECWYDFRGFDYHSKSGSGKTEPDYNKWTKGDLNGDFNVDRNDLTIFWECWYASRGENYYWN